MAYPPNQTSVVVVTAVCRGRKFTLTAIFFVLLPDQFHVFFNPKNVSETNAINITPPSIGQLEKRASSSPTDAVQH